MLVVVGIGWFLDSLFQPFKGDGEGRVGVVIPQGRQPRRDRATCSRAGASCPSSSFFQLRARLAGRSGDLKPGRYTLARDMSYAPSLDQLEQGLPPNVVAGRDPRGPVAARDRAVVDEGAERQLPHGQRRNPALDPRDYGAKDAQEPRGLPVPGDLRAEEAASRVSKLVDEQLTAFKRSFGTVDLRYARSKNLTPYDVLIIASLVEREAQVPKERPLIASVIYNRLHDGMPLGIDATMRFVTGKWTGPLTVSELQNPSPYNTRVAHRPAARADRQPRPGVDQGRGAPGARPTTCSTWSAVCGNGEHTFAATDAAVPALRGTLRPRARASAAASRRRTVDGARRRPRLPGRRTAARRR